MPGCSSVRPLGVYTMHLTVYLGPRIQAIGMRLARRWVHGCARARARATELRARQRIRSVHLQCIHSAGVAHHLTGLISLTFLCTSLALRRSSLSAVTTSIRSDTAARLHVQACMSLNT